MACCCKPGISEASSSCVVPAMPVTSEKASWALSPRSKKDLAAPTAAMPIMAMPATCPMPRPSPPSLTSFSAPAISCRLSAAEVEASATVAILSDMVARVSSTDLSDSAAESEDSTSVDISASRLLTESARPETISMSEENMSSSEERLSAELLSCCKASSMEAMAASISSSASSAGETSPSKVHSVLTLLSSPMICSRLPLVGRRGRRPAIPVDVFGLDHLLAAASCPAGARLGQALVVIVLLATLLCGQPVNIAEDQHIIEAVEILVRPVELAHEARVEVQRIVGIVAGIHLLDQSKRRA